MRSVDDALETLKLHRPLPEGLHAVRLDTWSQEPPLDQLKKQDASRRGRRLFTAVVKQVPKGRSAEPTISQTGSVYFLGGCIVVLGAVISKEESKQRLFDVVPSLLVPLAGCGVRSKEHDLHATVVLAEHDARRATETARRTAHFLESPSTTVLDKGVLVFHLVDIHSARAFRDTLRRLSVDSSSSLLCPLVAPAMIWSAHRPRPDYAAAGERIIFDDEPVAGSTIQCPYWGARLSLTASVALEPHVVLSTKVHAGRFLYSSDIHALLHLSRHPFIETYLDVRAPDDNDNDGGDHFVFLTEDVAPRRSVLNLGDECRRPGAGSRVVCSSATFEALATQLCLALSYCHQHGAVVGPLLPERIRLRLVESSSTSHAEGGSVRWGHVEVLGLGVAPRHWHCKRQAEYKAFDSPSHLRRELIDDGTPEWQATDDWASLAGLLFFFKTGESVWAVDAACENAESAVVSSNWQQHVTERTEWAMGQLGAAPVMSAPWHEMLKQTEPNTAAYTVGNSSPALLSSAEAKLLQCLFGAGRDRVDGATVLAALCRFVDVDLVDVFNLRCPVPWLAAPKPARATSVAPTVAPTTSTRQSSPPPRRRVSPRQTTPPKGEAEKRLLLTPNASDED